MHQLLNGGLTLRRVLFAVKIFGDDDFGGELRPGFGDFDAFLFENDFIVVVGNFRGALVPFDLVERLDLRIAKDAVDFE